MRLLPRLRPRVAATAVAVALVANVAPAQAVDPSAPSADGPAYACRQDVHAHDRTSPGEYVHVASLTQAANGDLLFGWVGGADEHSAETKRTYMARLPAGGSAWNDHVVVFDEPGLPDGNPVLWHDGEGRLYLFFSTILGDGWSTTNLRYVTSDDDGRTWSEPTVLRAAQGWNVGTAPVRMSNGETLLPLYDERFASAGFYVSGDDWQTWHSYPGLPAGPEVTEAGHAFAAAWPRGIQPATVELEPGHLLAFMRTGYDVLYRTESLDYGRTWTPSVPTDLPNPGARVALLKLDDGDLVLAWNPVDGAAPERSPMRLSLSSDGGRTWPHSVDVETNRDERYQYPYLTQTDDGFVHLGYTHARRTKNMRHVVFNPEFIRSGEDIVSSPETGRRPYVEGVPVPTERREYADGAFAEVARCAWSLPG